MSYITRRGLSTLIPPKVSKHICQFVKGYTCIVLRMLTKGRFRLQTWVFFFFFFLQHPMRALLLNACSLCLLGLWRPHYKFPHESVFILAFLADCLIRRLELLRMQPAWSVSWASTRSFPVALLLRLSLPEFWVGISVASSRRALPDVRTTAFFIMILEMHEVIC